ncbi:MAG: amino acid adenylation domain-containing protein [Pirellulales bacterium]|nr:amino acid adenylation domain-containing protein [Pirellulales bacterium]
MDTHCQRSHLVDVLRGYAGERGDDLAYLFLADGETDERRLSFAELDRRARAIATLLRNCGAQGERVLLIYEPGLEYISALYGCLYAGAVAVPAYPLEPLRINRELPRLEAIVCDAMARYVLTSTEILGWAEQLLRQTGHFDAVLATEGLDLATADDWRMPHLTADTLAILQYTSGSTGTPRGVMLGHGNLMQNLAALDQLDGPGARGVCWLPPYHDMGLIGGILMPAYRGRSMVLMSPLSFVQRPARWLQAISRYRGTSSASPNFGYELCTRRVSEEDCADLDLSCWSLACNGAEPVRAETLDRFYQKFAPYGLRRETSYPCYGMAEATLVISGGRRDGAPVVRPFSAAGLERRVACPPTAGDEPVRMLVGNGCVIPDHTLRIVDPASQQVLPDGQIGEIWVQGPSIAQGYWNRPEETHATFRACLHDAHGAATNVGPFLRTGDLGFLSDGELFITGRLKDLIIIAGRNHYPQDIEHTVQRAHDALKPDAGAAFSVEQDGAERLVVVQEVARPKKIDLDEVLAAARSAVLAAHDLQPAAIVLIQAQRLPKTTSGKVQRRECKRQYLAGELPVLAAWHAAGADAVCADSTAHEPPLGDTETQLAKLWSEVLGVSTPSRRDNFFDHGGHSLLAMQLISRINQVCGLELPPATLFTAPVLADLAAAMDRLREQSPAEREPLVVANDHPRQAASCGQAGLWFLDRLHAGRSGYQIAARVTLDGPLDRAALRGALAEIVARHEPLRTAFDNVDGVPFQVIANEIELPWHETDLTHYGEQRQDGEVARLADSDAARPFALNVAPLWRVRLVTLSPQRHVLLAVFHHAITDGCSMEVLRGEWNELYLARLENRPARLPRLAARYRDFVATQRRALGGPEYEARLAAWRERLAGASELALPFDHPRAAASSSSGCLGAELPSELSAALSNLGRRHDATLFMTLLAAWQVLLYRTTAQSDISVGAPVAGRARREFENLIGFFANTVVLRGDLAGSPGFAEFLGRVRATVVAALADGDLPLERVVEALHPHRAGHGQPLFQSLFAFEELPDETLAAGDAIRARVEVDYRWMLPLPLSLVIERRGRRIQSLILFDRGRFDERTICDLQSAWHELLHSIVANPTCSIDALPMVDTATRAKLLDEWNGAATTLPEGNLIDLIQAQVTRTPRAVAAVHRGSKLSYTELDQRSAAVARYLASRGVGRGDLVGLYCQRSLDMIVALLGVLKSGAAYVPLDPMYPRERLESMLSDAEVALVLTHERLLGTLPAGDYETVCVDRDWSQIALATTEPATQAAPDDLAYVIYTSGSTGRPKGVEVTQRGVINMLCSSAHYPGFEADDVLLAVTTLSFDIAVVELFLPLVVGSRVVIADSEVALDPQRLIATLEDNDVTLLQCTPVTWRMLVDHGWQPRPGFRAYCGGEALDPNLAAKLLDLGVELWNLYGPTETSVWSTSERITPETEVICVGHPLDNTRLYVLDAARQLVPPGVVGELYIGGVGVARGYRGRPELNAERFLADPFQPARDDRPARMYRTGDLVRWRNNGALECLGRVDHQVKLRGFRIELGEIEAVLREHPEIRDVVVVAREIGTGDKRLVAYYAAAQRRAAPVGELRGLLERRLPAYMVPGAFVELPQLPRTPNGKLDRAALPDPAELEMPADRAVVAPRNETERRLRDIWARLLGYGNFGVEDSFFEIGGHSLLAVQMVAQIEREFGRWLPVATLFSRPTIAELAELLRRPATADAVSPLVPIQRRGAQRPLFCVHPAGGTVFCYLTLAPHLGADQPIYGLQARGLDGEAEPHGTVEEMAAAYLQLVRRQQPQGPYRLAGWSFGGVVAVEMAQQLRALGENVEMLVVFDTVMMPPEHPTTENDILQTLVEMLHGEEQLTVEQLRALSHDEQLDYFRSRAERARLVTSDWNEQRFSLAFQVFQANLQALFRYRPRPYDGAVTVVRATQKISPAFNSPSLGWSHWVRGALRLYDVDCEHLQMFRDPCARQIGQFVASLLADRVPACGPHYASTDDTVALV